jgi:hypothetical protein
MAVITNYNPDLHDIYTYNGTPVLNRLNPPGPNNYVYATGYNQRNIIKNGNYNFPNIDWSGLHVRPRGFIGYGWSDSNNDGTIDALSQFSPGGFGNNSTCFNVGCPPGDFSKAENYNYWNNGAFAAILISPRHLLVCRHYAGDGINLTMSINFIGKDGTIYPSKTARKAATFGFLNSTDQASGVITLSQYSNDYFIYRLDTALTSEEQQNIKIYPLVKYSAIPPSTPCFIQDPNGKLRMKLVNGFSYGQPILADYPSTDPNIPQIAGVHVGDSGSPCLIYLNGETCFLANLNGGEFVYEQNLVPLREYVFQDSGYTIPEVDGGFTPDTIPDIQFIEKTTPLSQFPYLSRFSASIQSLNFERIGYNRGSQVQASELNEIQENFYNQQSKTIEMVSKWFGNKLLKQQTGGITFSGPTNISPSFISKYGTDVFNTKWSIFTSVDPNQIKMSVNDTVTILSGWYFLKATNEILFDLPIQPTPPQKTTLYKWIFIPNDYVISLNSSQYFAVDTSSYTLRSSNEFLQDNTYPEDVSKPNGAIRFGTEVTNQETLSEPIPTSGITLSNPIVLYKENGRYYLPNGYQIT